MKKFTLLLVVCFSVLLSNHVFAQKNNGLHTTTTAEKCATMPVLERYLNETPGARERYEKNLKNSGTTLLNNSVANRTNAITTIPVVVHIVLPNPYQISDADVQFTLDQWNKDFSGLNPDSTNGVNFYNVRGHSEIRFALAKRTPTGTLTNGVDRRSSTTAFTLGNPEPIKRSAQGGIDSWDNTSYLNIWVGVDGSGAGILGYATFPGTASALDDGIVINYQGFGLNPCYTPAPYNIGRTTAHEIGHYLGLYHIWGDENGCNGDDFRQLGGTVLFPSGLFNPTGTGNTAADIGDTPNQAGSTTNCPTGTVTDACSNVAPGKMYQNYMDYTADACYSMFTNKQVARMQWIIDNARSGLKTSLALTPPAGAVLLDAALVSTVSPGGSEYIGCTLTNYPSSSSSCGSSNVNISPKVRVQNNGVTTLNSVTVTYTVNGGAGATQTFTGLNLITGYSTVLTFTTPYSITATGPYNFQYTVSAPNGGTDQVAGNNNSSGTFTLSILTPVNAPVIEGFENATFPPTNWTLSQLSGVGNFARVTTAAKSGTASAKFDNWNYAAGISSALTSPNINFNPATTLARLTFHYAHQSYTAAPGSEPDRLEVLVSTNCGATWTSLWSRQGSQLNTATPANAFPAFTPTAAQWTQLPIIVDLTAYKNQTVQIQFIATSGFGNNLYLDDINIEGIIASLNDAGITAINSPAASFCSSSFTPQVVVTNFGSNALTSVNVVYAVDPTTPGPVGYTTQSFTGLNVPSNGTVILTCNPLTGITNGNHFCRMYTSLPNGVVDTKPINDTLLKNFVANTPVAIPLVEGFEGTAFNPTLTGWRVLNPNAGSLTWTRATTAAKTGAASAMIDCFNYATAGQLDYLYSPVVNFSTFDSAFINFQYAYRPYSATFSDTLEVVVSTDCGTTWTSIWKKGGTELSTVAGFATANFVPTASQWSVAPTKLDLSSFLNAGNLFVGFRSKNGFGNKIYLDDINILGINLPNYDANVQAITAPFVTVCDVPATVSFTVKNEGKVTMTSLQGAYTVDGGTPVTQSFTTNLTRGQATSLTFTTPISTLTAGTHVIRIYTSLPNGIADQNVTNDTLNKTFTFIQKVATPLVESFEDLTFPPANWSISQQPVDAITWQRNISSQASDGKASAWMNNRAYTFNSRIDDLISPVLAVPVADSVFLNFDVAAATRTYPGATALPLDTLEVMITRDCGQSFQSVYKKWGWQLQTLSDPNSPYTDSFKVTQKFQWRTEKVNLTRLLAAGATARVVFRNTENNDNNIYLDKVNLYTKNVSAKVKANGYMIAPNPFSGSFAIQHYLAPTELRSIGVFNSLGQQLMMLNYNGNADSYITIDMNRFAAGVYIVKLVYTNKTISQKVIKQ